MMSSDLYRFFGQTNWGEEVQFLTPILPPEFVLKYAHFPEIILYNKCNSTGQVQTE